MVTTTGHPWLPNGTLIFRSAMSGGVLGFADLSRVGSPGFWFWRGFDQRTNRVTPWPGHAVAGAGRGRWLEV
jgi:hypothetical protein